jgi:hypothetical protein
MSSIYQVELREHIGTMNKGGEVVEVRHPQWIVVSRRGNDPFRQVGYLGTHEGAKLCLLAGIAERIGPMLVAELEEAVREALAAKKQAVTNGE